MPSFGRLTPQKRSGIVRPNPPWVPVGNGHFRVLFGCRTRKWFGTGGGFLPPSYVPPPGTGSPRVVCGGIERRLLSPFGAPPPEGSFWGRIARHGLQACQRVPPPLWGSAKPSWSPSFLGENLLDFSASRPNRAVSFPRCTLFTSHNLENVKLGAFWLHNLFVCHADSSSLALRQGVRHLR